MNSHIIIRQFGNASSLSIIRIAFFGLFILMLATGCKPANVDEKHTIRTGTSGTSQLAKDMIGTWVHVGRPGHVMEPPAKGARFKSRTGTHWIITMADPDSGLVKEVFGGTYTITGTEYVETQTFSDNTWLHDNGNSAQFIASMEGDIMTQIGVGNPYTEVWKRVK